MANTVVGHDGVGRPNLLPAIGSFCPLIPFSVTVSGTTTSETVTFSQLAQIKGVIVQVLDSGNNEVAVTGLDLTWSGNVLTMADGGSFDLDTSGYTYYGLVWGTPRA